VLAGEAEHEVAGQEVSEHLSSPPQPYVHS